MKFSKNSAQHMGVGVAIGVAIGTATNNLAGGIVIGIVIGLLMDAGNKRKQEKDATE